MRLRAACEDLREQSVGERIAVVESGIFLWATGKKTKIILSSEYPLVVQSKNAFKKYTESQHFLTISSSVTEG
ncbi:hypothetical protein SP90_00925 [Halodesulfovibrio spirochaetisodalis]|uniref:Uncharacterized protein n=1 Tax=Halodesulfovibrio spirochaetisodalis TaxID=1560234 RepID=A0A1B7XQ43_9BACT|nr:hypothetical protein SP90_00925 [Halodesulfovibrio spirochaetisodalis]